jgi:hypothetical protein
MYSTLQKSVVKHRKEKRQQKSIPLTILVLFEEHNKKRSDRRCQEYRVFQLDMREKTRLLGYQKYTFKS